nr:hypothetical protein Iba_chr13cCG15490 [Ipomoea batatas]
MLGIQAVVGPPHSYIGGSSSFRSIRPEWLLGVFGYEVAGFGVCWCALLIKLGVTLVWGSVSGAWWCGLGLYTYYISIATADVANVLGLPNGLLPMSERDDQLVWAGNYVHGGRRSKKGEKGRITGFERLFETTTGELLLVANMVGDMVRQNTPKLMGIRNFQEGGRAIKLLLGVKTKRGKGGKTYSTSAEGAAHARPKAPQNTTMRSNKPG